MVGLATNTQYAEVIAAMVRSLRDLECTPGPLEAAIVAGWSLSREVDEAWMRVVSGQCASLCPWGAGDDRFCARARDALLIPGRGVFFYSCKTIDPRASASYSRFSVVKTSPPDLSTNVRGRGQRRGSAPDSRGDDWDAHWCRTSPRHSSINHASLVVLL